MIRRVRGILFVDYVRMIRSQKQIDWTVHLYPEDLKIIDEKVDPEAWYPMETFERLGLGILRTIAMGQLDAVRMWGGFQVGSVRRMLPNLIAEGDPQETMMRFRVLATSFFDFGALKVEIVEHDHAEVSINYGMSHLAEETACTQTLGFFERMIEVAGAIAIDAKFRERSWLGDERTTIELFWRMPGRS
jgi:hypothetical protein